MPQVERVALLDGETAERRAHVLPHGDAAPTEDPLERRLARKALDRLPELRESRGALDGRVANDRRDLLGNADASAETAPSAPASIPCWMSASGPTKTSKPGSR